MGICGKILKSSKLAIGTVCPFASKTCIRFVIMQEFSTVDVGGIAKFLTKELLLLRQEQKPIHENEGVCVHFQQ